MHKTYCLLLCSLACLIAGIAYPATATAQVGDSILPYYELPKEAKTPIVTFNYRGGQIRAINDEATMSILSDGTVVMPKKYQHSKAYQGKLMEGEVQDLLHFIIGTNEFFKYDKEVVAEKIKNEKLRIRNAGGGIGRIMDASTVEIYVNANGKTNTASHYPSGIDESKVPELVHFAAIKKRLSHLISVTQLGGNNAVEQWLKKANETLLAEHPQAEPLIMDDFRGGSVRNNGTVYVNFTRLGLDENGKPNTNHITAVIINKPEKGEAVYNVTFNRPAKK